MNILLVYDKANRLVGATDEPINVSHEEILKAWCHRQGFSSQAHAHYRLDLCPVTSWKSLQNAANPPKENKPESTIVLDHAGGYESFIFNIVESTGKEGEPIYKTEVQRMLTNLETNETRADNGANYPKIFDSPRQALLAIATEECDYLS